MRTTLWYEGLKILGMVDYVRELECTCFRSWIDRLFSIAGKG